MADPTYKGAQPSSVTRFIGGFMNPTPNYVGAGQPAQRSSLFGGTSPPYAPAPAKPAPTPTTDDDSCALPDPCVPPGFLLVVPRTDEPGNTD